MGNNNDFYFLVACFFKLPFKLTCEKH